MFQNFIALFCFPMLVDLGAQGDAFLVMGSATNDAINFQSLCYGKISLMPGLSSLNNCFIREKKKA